MDQSKYLKQGDTFIRECRYKADGINYTPLTSDIEVASSVKTSDGQLHPLTVIPDPDQVIGAGKFILICFDTQLWALGKAKYDIQYTTADFKHSSDTLIFTVIEDITP